ncbi:hypothetical protein LSH36_208g04078 [Paralvinella palmiformis]|uniref:Uncharacterized protein n=1 Tax=Paralvinella palmiformis TaxID=53620 RepID=A0AAD9N4Q2_9ANNE|nr:hypothetical protein LSH36_208g04078 [Paralvinella palmiformis]
MTYLLARVRVNIQILAGRGPVVLDSQCRLAIDQKDLHVTMSSLARDLYSKWIEVKICLNDLTSRCEAEKKNGTETRMTFEGIVARKRAEQAANEWIKGYDYLCYEGKTGYSVVRECMSRNENLTSLTEECYKTYENQTWWLNPKEPLNIYKFCKAAQQFFGCFEKFTKQGCDEQFADWVRTFHEHLWFPHLHQIGCHIGSKIAFGEITMVSMCGGTTAFCAFFILLSFLYKPENKITKRSPTQRKPPIVHFGETNQSFVKDNGELTAADNQARKVPTVTKSLEITKM